MLVKKLNVLTVIALLISGVAWAAPAREAKPKEVWTDSQDASLPADFKIQGEYLGEVEGGGKLGAQVIALGKGAFQTVLYPGGLPGAGSDGKSKVLLDGRSEAGGDVAFKSIAGAKKKYLAQSPEEFAATSNLTPETQKNYQAKLAAGGESMSGKTDDGKAFTLKKTVRVSPTMGAKPPEGAIVLFDGSGKGEWNGGRVDEKTKFLNTDGGETVSKKKFKDYTVHCEFMLPYRPDARGQGRGNSGFYQVDQYEVQVLDSFGLDGKNNECGGIYTKAEPKLNMCLPPLTWQTYDIEFKAAETDAAGKKIKGPRITAKLNGVVIHDDVEIPGVTGGARQEPEGTPGSLRLQGHGNPLQYRNIWVVEKK